MTKNDIVGNGDGGLRPVALPPFSSFAVKRISDDIENAFEADELAGLHPGAVPVRRQSFRLGRAAAHAALRAIGRDDAPILPGPDRAPVWPAGVTGSISHTATIGVALVAPTDECGGIGIDIEERRHAPELTDQVPRPEERAWLEAAPGNDRDRLTLALFSAKETIFKAFFPRVGSFFGFDAASLRPVEGGFTARLTRRLDADYPPDREFIVHCRWDAGLLLSWLVLPRA